MLAERLLDVLHLVALALPTPFFALGALAFDGLTRAPQRLARVWLAAAAL